jgi:hypothetical protein
MHDDRAETTVNNLLNGLAEEEIGLLKDILTKVSEISSNWGVRTAPHSSVLRHLYQRRLIRHLLPDESNFLEIGPGAGYLSLMLALDGMSVCNIDVTQAYYVFQHYLYSSFECLEELASVDTVFPRENEKQTSAGKVRHMPWWFFKDLPTCAISVDVIIVNHAICEMHRVAVQHLLSVAQRLEFPKFFMESTGLDSVSLTFDKVKSIFLSYGYSLTYSKNDVYIFEYKKSNSRSRVVGLGKRVIKRLLSLIPFSMALKEEFSRINLEITTLIRFLIWRRSREKSIFKPSHIRYEDVLHLYEQVLGKPNFRSLDEEFLKSIKPMRLL